MEVQFALFSLTGKHNWLHLSLWNVRLGLMYNGSTICIILTNGITQVGQTS